MFAKERRSLIYERLKANGAVTTGELMKTFSVSIETIRRDLLVMEQHKLLQRVHGGAVAVGKMKTFQDLSYRVSENENAKRELTKLAAQLIQDGDVLGIDTGSTAIYFAEALKERFHRLTIITHSLDVFECLSRYKEFQVILCGGYLLQKENSFYGILAIDMLKKLHMQKVFLFPSAISLAHGICDYQEELYQIQRQLLECGDHIFVLADSSKYETNALLKIDDMKQNYTYVTDSNLSHELKHLYQENDIKIITGKEDLI